MMKTVRQDVISTIFRFLLTPLGEGLVSGCVLTIVWSFDRDVHLWGDNPLETQRRGNGLSYESFFVGIREKNDSVGMKYSLWEGCVLYIQILNQTR